MSGFDGGWGSGYRATGRGGGGGGGGVTSFNGRTGAVVPQLGDYGSDIVGDLSSWGGPTVEDSLNLSFIASTFLSDELEASGIVCDSFGDLTWPSLTWSPIDTVLTLVDTVAPAQITRVGAAFTFAKDGQYIVMLTANVPGNGCMFGYRLVDSASPGIGQYMMQAWAGAEPTEHTYQVILPVSAPRTFELQYVRGAGLNSTFVAEVLDGETMPTARISIWRIPGV